jgi:hypothetical protein
LDRRLGGPQSRSGRRGEEKILVPTSTRTPTSLVVQPVAIPTTLSRLLVLYLWTTDYWKKLKTNSETREVYKYLELECFCCAIVIFMMCNQYRLVSSQNILFIRTRFVCSRIFDMRLPRFHSQVKNLKFATSTSSLF